MRFVQLTPLLGLAIAACTGGAWPEPPALDASSYAAEMDVWRQARFVDLTQSVRLIGIWSLSEGDTPFGADSTLPITLRGAGVPERVGLFRRRGTVVSVEAAPGSPLRLADSVAISGTVELHSVMDPTPSVLTVGSIRLQIEEVEEVAKNADPRRWVSARDVAHPPTSELRPIETYPVSIEWRVAARFDAFDAPKVIQVADVRGGTIDLVAAGELVFRLRDREFRLTAINDGSSEFLVMLRDSTSGRTTYGGYRYVVPPVVADGAWTVLDFNKLANPPCAFSAYTTCPLAPRENRVPLAIEAGEKAYPDSKGFVPR